MPKRKKPSAQERVKMSESMRRDFEHMNAVLKQMEPQLQYGAKRIKEVVDAFNAGTHPAGLGADYLAVKFPEPAHRTNIPAPFLEFRDGSFYTKGKRVDFPDPSADYVAFAMALHFEADQNGFASYERIVRFMEKETKRHGSGRRMQEKRVLNACASLYRPRKRQKNPFPKRTPGGDPIVENVPGKGYIFRVR
jgi:hypothetical protein